MPLLENEAHKRYHQLGPKDVSWGTEKGLMKKKTVCMHFNITRSTIDNEQVTVQVPIFEEDSREELKERMGMAYSIVQDRLDEANEAWAISAAKAEAEEAAAKKE